MQNWSSRLTTSLLSYWNRNEKYVFFIALVINIIPVVTVDYFFTGDGPAHLYNANLIAQLLEHPEGRAAQFFYLREALIPNLGGHALLVFFNVFFHAALAEKLVYVLCLTLLPMSFRYCIRSTAPAQLVWCYFVFPLSHSFCFYIGFQSFCLGLALMLFSIGFLKKFWNNTNIKNALILAILLFITATFHLFTAVLAVLVIGAFILFQKWRGQFFKKLMVIILVILPTVLFCVGFLTSAGQKGSFAVRSFSDSLNDLITARILITLDYAEKPFALTFAVVVGLSLLYLVFIRSARLKNRDNYFVLIAAFATLILYFVFPDQLASGGFISLRLLLCFYLLFTLWIASTIRPSLIALSLIATLVVLHISMVAYHVREAEKLSEDAVSINEAAAHIPAGSTVLPLNYSAHWLHYNIGLYPGGIHNLIILDNYEGMTNHFPVVWIEKSFPGDQLGDYAYSKRPLLKIAEYEAASGQVIDAIIRWKYSSDYVDASTQKTDSLLRDAFTKVYVSENGNAEIHLRKSAFLNSP
jgi:hypothetical protein